MVINVWFIVLSIYILEVQSNLDISNKFVGPLTVLIFDLNNGKLKSFNSVGIRLFHKKKIEKIYCEYFFVLERVFENVSPRHDRVCLSLKNIIQEACF